MLSDSDSRSQVVRDALKAIDKALSHLPHGYVAVIAIPTKDGLAVTIALPLERERRVAPLAPMLGAIHRGVSYALEVGTSIAGPSVLDEALTVAQGDYPVQNISISEDDMA